MNFFANKILDQTGNEIIQNRINEISSESIYLGLFEGTKILLISLAAGLFIRLIY